jgi:hypothetical protein
LTHSHGEAEWQNGSSIRCKKPTSGIKNELAFKKTVRSRVYSLYESRARGDGHVDDWVVAELQVNGVAAKNKRTGQPEAIS